MRAEGTAETTSVSDALMVWKVSRRTRRAGTGLAALLGAMLVLAVALRIASGGIAPAIMLAEDAAGFVGVLALYLWVTRQRGATVGRGGLRWVAVAIAGAFFLMVSFTEWFPSILVLWAALAIGETLRRRRRAARAIGDIWPLTTLPGPLLGAVVAAAALHWLIQAGFILYVIPYQVDFNVYFAAGAALHANPGANIYSLDVLRHAAAAHPGATLPVENYFYPPLLAVALQPLTLLPFKTAATIWIVGNLLVWLGCVVLLMSWASEVLATFQTTMPVVSESLARGRGWWRARSPVERAGLALTAFLALSYVPLEHGIILGQISGLILLLLLAMPLLVRRGLPEVAGGALALAIMLKVLPLALVPYLIVRRQWRLLLGMLGGLIVLTGAMIPAGVPLPMVVQGILGDALNHFDTNSTNFAHFNNQGLSQIPLWLALAFGGKPDSATTWLGYTLIGAVGISYLWILRLTWRAMPHATPASGHLDLLGWGWAICAMLLMSPITWQHYYDWLLPVIMVGLCLALGVLWKARSNAGSVGGAAQSVRAALVLGAVMAGAYLLTMGQLPYLYDFTARLTLGPTVLGQPVRPFFMVLRPLAAVVAWIASGLLVVMGASGAPAATMPQGFARNPGAEGASEGRGARHAPATPA